MTKKLAAAAAIFFVLTACYCFLNGEYWVGIVQAGAAFWFSRLVGAK